MKELPILVVPHSDAWFLRPGSANQFEYENHSPTPVSRQRGRWSRSPLVKRRGPLAGRDNFHFKEVEMQCCVFLHLFGDVFFHRQKRIASALTRYTTGTSCCARVCALRRWAMVGSSGRDSRASCAASCTSSRQPAAQPDFRSFESPTRLLPRDSHA